MAASRVQPRKPDWLAQTPSGQRGPSQPAPAPQPDTTARVLEFPGTALRRPATAAAGPAATPFSSTLSVEPAYKSALARLTKGPAAATTTLATAVAQPATAPTAASTAAAPPLPSSRLDALLAGGLAKRTARPLASAAQPPSSRADVLLSHRSVSSAQPPSARLDALLSKPARPPRVADAAGTALASRQQSLGDSLTLAPAAGTLQTATAGAAAAAALSPVAEEEPALAAAAAGPPQRSLLAMARPAEQQAQGDAAVEGVAGGLPRHPAAAAAATGLGLNPGLQDRLRERIELAKVQIRQQMSPMFQLSHALVGAESDPGRAADALEAATRLSAFERLARRPSRRGAPAAASAAAAPAALLSAGAAGSSSVAVVAEEEGEASRMLLSLQGAGRQQRELQQQQQPLPLPAQSPTRDSDDPLLISGAAGGSSSSSGGGSSNGAEVEVRMANARVAAQRVHKAIADLVPPPPQQALRLPAPPIHVAGHGSAPRSTALPQPYAQLTVSAAGVAADRSGLQLTGSVAASPPAVAGAWVGQLRQQAEALIRAECEQLVSSMHTMFDGLLEGVQRQPYRQQQDHHQQQQPDQSRMPLSDVASDSARFSSTSSLRSSPPSSGSSSPTTAAAKAAAGSALASGSQGEELQEGGLQLQAAAAAEELQEVVSSNVLPAAKPLWPAPTDLPEPPKQQQQQPVAEDDSPENEQGQHAQLQPQQQQQVMSEAGGTTAGSLVAGQAEREGQLSKAGSSSAASSSAGHPPHPQQAVSLRFAQLGAGGPWGAGFGSPIRLPSQYPSPAKCAATAAMAAALSGQGASAGAPAAVHSTTLAAKQQQLHQALATTAKSLSLGAASCPAASEYTTPVFELRLGSIAKPALPSSSSAAGAQQQQLPRGNLGDPYHTTRSMAAAPGYWTARSTMVPEAASPLELGSLGPASTCSSWPAGSGGSGRFSGIGSASVTAGIAAATATPGSSSLSSGRWKAGMPASSSGAAAAAAASGSPPLLGGSAGRDLAGISASIRRMAAEMRLKHGALAARPLPGRWPSSASKQPVGGACAGSCLLPTPVVSLRSALVRPASAAWHSSGGGDGGGSAGGLYRKPLR